MFSQNLPIEWISSEGSGVIRVIDGMVAPGRGAGRQILLQLEACRL